MNSTEIDSTKKQGEEMSKEKTNQDYNKQKPDPNDPNQINENRDIEYKENENDIGKRPNVEEESINKPVIKELDYDESSDKIENTDETDSNKLKTSKK